MFKKILKKFDLTHLFIVKKLVRINKKRRKKIESSNISKLLVKEYEDYYKRKPNLNNPTRFSEILLWQKLYFHKSESTIMSDKVLVKDYIKKLLGDEINFPKTYAVFDNAKQISLQNLPNKSIIKCNHNSGYIFFIHKKSNKKYEIENLKDRTHKKIRFKTMQKILNELLKINYYYQLLEWNYKEIKPRILVEEYLDTTDLRDYKFLMNYGKLIVFHVNSNKAESERINFFNEKLEPLDIWEVEPPAENIPKLPHNISKMIEISKKIANGFPFLRVDLYTINNNIYFGETTFFHWGGYLRFKHPKNFDELIGSKMTINLNH
ncbi:MAG: ATP-grasp fold amidoligase family protein [Bacilli bacterium]